MWIEATKNGKYKACERYTDPLTGKLKKVSVTIDKDTRQTRKAAQEELAERIRQELEKSPNADLTMGQLVEAYLSDKKLTLRESSYRTMGAKMRSLLKVIPETAKVRDLTAAAVSRLIKSSSDKPVTINGRIKTLHLLLSWGYGADLVPDRSLIDKTGCIKDNRKARIEDKYLEPQELTTLLAGMDYTRWILLTKLLVLSGMRIGEAIALRVSDLDGEYIHIARTFQSNIGKTGDVPKTADSVRDIYIQPELKALLSEIKRWRLEYMMRQGYRSDLLIPGIVYATYCRYLARVSARLIGKRITPHALRHTHVSVLAAQGVPFDAIARRLGHHDDAITREVYFHVTERLKQRDQDELRNVKIL